MTSTRTVASKIPPLLLPRLRRKQRTPRFERPRVAKLAGILERRALGHFDPAPAFAGIVADGVLESHPGMEHVRRERVAHTFGLLQLGAQGHDTVFQHSNLRFELLQI